LYALLITIISIFTGEIVTFIMLGLILISLRKLSLHIYLVDRGFHAKTKLMEKEGGFFYIQER